MYDFQRVTALRDALARQVVFAILFLVLVASATKLRIRRPARPLGDVPLTILFRAIVGVLLLAAIVIVALTDLRRLLRYRGSETAATMKESGLSRTEFVSPTARNVRA
jgi:hypothetical protein